MSEDRVESLEVKVAFQERTIEELNGGILELWKEIAALKRQILRLEDQLQRVEADVPASPEPPPPHY